MSNPAGAWDRFGAGPLARGAALIYHLLIVELLLVVTAGPGLVPLILLHRDASNLPLVAACALPVGPALGAAVYALQHRRLDLTELRPAAMFWRGYRLGAWGVLRIWVPWLVWVTVLAISLAHLGAAGVPRWWSVLLVVVALAATLWVMNALVITSLFTFRTRDVAKLAAYFLGRTPGATLGNACLLIVTAAAVGLTSEAVLALLGSVFALVLLHNTRPMITAVREEFTA